VPRNISGIQGLNREDADASVQSKFENINRRTSDC